MRRLLGLALIALSIGCQASAPPTNSAREVRVAAAADLRASLDEVVAGFREQHPEIQVQVTYGSSGNLFAQLQNEAPFDLFLSADVEYPRRLIESGHAERDSLFVYAIGHLVVWAPRSSSLDVEKLGVQALLDPGVKKIAIANPKHAPYGRAAEAALKKLGLYDRVRDRLVLGDNVAQTAQFVQTGAADVGIIALSLARSPALRNVGKYAEVPADAYPHLEQGGVFTARTKDRDAAVALRDFLRGEAGRAVLRKYGFDVPEN